MRDNRFKRIIREIKNGEVKIKKDRDDIFDLAKKFIQKEDLDLFLIFDGKYPKILDENSFEKFVLDFLDIKSLEYFDNEVLSKKESVNIYKNSKRKNIHTDENCIVIRKRGKRAKIYYKEFPKTDKKIVAIENYETFLNLDFSLFKENYFVLLNGYPNKMVKEFLKNKKVTFFVDFDLFGIDIFNSIECKKKKFFLPKNIEKLLKKFGSVELYKKQNFKKNNLKFENKKVKYLFELINKYSKCLEQEILNVN